MKKMRPVLGTVRKKDHSYEKANFGNNILDGRFY